MDTVRALKKQFVERRSSIARCSCGGRFSEEAPVRCPKCKSTNLQKGSLVCMYD